MVHSLAGRELAQVENHRPLTESVAVPEAAPLGEGLELPQLEAVVDQVHPAALDPRPSELVQLGPRDGDPARDGLLDGPAQHRVPEPLDPLLALQGEQRPVGCRHDGHPGLASSTHREVVEQVPVPVQVHDIGICGEPAQETACAERQEELVVVGQSIREVPYPVDLEPVKILQSWAAAGTCVEGIGGENSHLVTPLEQSPRQSIGEPGNASVRPRGVEVRDHSQDTERHAVAG